MARRSTWVDPQGTQMMILGLGRRNRFSWTLRMKYFNMTSVTVKSAITPSFIGLIAWMFPGVRPSMRFASWPTASTVLLPPPTPVCIATTEGSFNIMPLSRT